MPGKRPSGAPPPATTRGLHPCPGARGLRRPSQPPHEDQPPSSRTAQGTRAAGSRALAGEPPTAQSGQALEVKPQAELLRSLSFRGPLGKGGGPDTPPSRSHPGAKVWLAGRVDSSPLQLYGPGTASPRTTPTLDGTPESRPHKPQDSQAEAHRKPSLPGADALPTPEELRSQRCFQEAPTSFTSSNYTSPSATPGPAWAPPSSPPTLASLPELQANRASSWPPAAEDNFPGANFGVPPTKSEPFPEGSRPSPRGSPFPYPLQAQAPHEDAVGQAYANGALAFPFHQPPGGWTEVAMGTGPAYQLPPTPSPLPCYPSQPGGLEASGDCAHALSPAGAAPLTPRPFPDSLHKSLAKVLPEGTPSGHEGLGSSRAPPNPGSQRHFPGQAYGASKVGSSSGPGDTKLATPRPLPARLPQMWEPTAAAYPEPTLHPPPTPGATFFDSPGQQLCLPQSPTVPWPSALPSPRPSPGHLEVLSQLPFPRGTTEWQEGSRGALGAASQAPRPGETMVALRTSPCQPGSSPGLFPYSAVKDPGAQPLFFGGTQPQASPRGAPGLPLSRVVGVSPSGSPLPSPATNTASSSTCSSLSPLSSSPANPSSEDSQLPAPLGPSGFLLPAPHPQETESPFQPPEPTSTGPAHFPLPSDGLESEGALEFPGSEGHRAGRDGLRSFPQGPVAYTAHHFPLSSASLDQLDVLLTCRQCDRNYSSLAAFLEHRQFCALLLARHGPQEHPAPNATPKAPAPTHPDLLGHSQAIPFLLAGDLQAESKEDTLRTSFLPSLAAPPFPLPTSDLDLEDNAKLDSLITEALNGMQDPSDSPEIDSSFIDVFADEDPPGPRGPSAGQPLSTPAGATQEHHAQPLPPAGEATPQPQTPCPGDRATVPLLGPTPPEAPAHPLGRQPRRGKQLKGFWKELDAARSTEEPRRRGHGPQQPPPHAQDLRTQAKGHMDPDERDPRALFLPEDAGTTRRLRLPPRTDLRKQRARRGSSWSKELIHKIVLQKNKPYRPQAPSRTPRGRGDLASGSAGDPGPGPGLRGRSHRGRRQQCQGKMKEQCQGKMKEDSLGRCPGRVVRPGPAESRGSPAHSLDGDPRCTGHPKDLPQVPMDTTTPEESHLPLGLCQASPKPETADPTKLRKVPTGEGGHPKPPTPEPPLPGRAGASRRPPLGRRRNVMPRHQGTPSCKGLPKCHDREDAPARQPTDFQTPAASPTRESCPEPATPFFKNSDPSRNPAHFNRDPVGVSAAKKGPQPNSSALNKLFLRPKDLAVDTPPASSCYLGQDHVDALKPKPAKNPPYTAETDPGRAQSLLTLESMALFAGLPEDSLDPPLYGSLSPHRATPEPLACADPLPRKPLTEPLFSPFLLLEEVSPTLSSQFPDVSGSKAFRKKCPHEETAPPSPAPVPGRRRNEHSAAFMSSLSEDELEIKRLVSELESQLQKRGGTQEAPEDPKKAACAASLMPGCQATSSHSSAALPSPGESSPQQEDTGTAVSSGKGALQSPQGDQPCPATCHPRKAAPCPGPLRDLASGALTAQKGRGCKAEEDPGAPLGVCLPEPSKQPEALLEPAGLAEHDPNLFPRSDELIRTQKSKGAWAPEPLGAGGPCPDRPATPALDQVFQGSGEASLDAIPTPGAGHSHASKEPAPGGPGPPPTPAEGSALQHWEAPSHHGPCVNTASSPSSPLWVLGARAEDDGSTQVWQGPPSAAAQSPQHRAPPGLGGDRATGGSPGGVQDMATSTVSEADGHLGSPGQAEKPKGQSKASHCLPEAWKSTGAPGNGAKANTLPRRHGPAWAATRPQGGSTALGPREQVRPTSSPWRLSGMAAHAQQGPEDRIPGEVTSLVPPTRDLAPCTVIATPNPCGPEHTPPEDPCCMSLGVAGWVQAPASVGATGTPTDPPLSTSLCGPEDITSPALLGPSSPEDWPGLRDIPTPTQGQDGLSSSTLATLEDIKRGPGGSPAPVTPSYPEACMSPRRTIKEHGENFLSESDIKAVRELQVWDPSMSWDPSSHAPCLTRFKTATPTDHTTAGSTRPGPSPCLEREAGPVSERQEDTGTSGAGHSRVTKVAGAGPQGLTTACSPPDASPSNIASDSGPNSPQSHIRVPHHLEPLSPQDPKQQPDSLKKKPEPTERRKGQAPAGPPVPCVTCEVCSASFRSGPGLSRHKSRRHRPDGYATLGHGTPRKKSRRVPGRERPSHPAGPAPPQGSTTPGGTPVPKTEEGAERGSKALGYPLNQQLQPPGLRESGEGAKPRPDLPGASELHPGQTKRKGQEQDQGPKDSPRTTAPKPQAREGKTRAQRPLEEDTPPHSASATTGQCHSQPSMSTADCSVEGHRGADGGLGPLGDAAANTGLEVLCAENTTTQKSPGGGRSPRGRSEAVYPGELPEGWKGPTVARTSSKDPSHAFVGEAVEDHGVSESGPSNSVRVGTLGLPGLPGSEVGSTMLSCPQGLPDAPEARRGDPEAPLAGCRDPLSMLDDMSFAQLFPPGGRFARKKNPRVYQKRCGRLRRVPPTEPLSQAGDDPPSLARPPTDLSDSGSLCLSCEDLLGNQATELPESWLLGGPMNSSTPGLGLWALEPSKEASCADKALPCDTTGDQVKTIPELHRVPAAWRGLGLQVPPKEASSPPGDVSPEPPNLEREGYEQGMLGTAEDLEMVGTTPKAQDLCFTGPCDDLVCLPSTSALDLREEAAGPCQAPGREQPAPGRRASFKCRVCFRRFHGLGELDLHRLAHSAAPPPTCYMCVERKFGSRQLLRKHLQEKHVQGQVGPWACGMCLKEVADIWMYNQHLREHAALFALAQVGRPVSPGSLALPRLCPQAVPGAAQTPDRREDPAGHRDLPTAGPDLPPAALSPLPNAQAEGREGCEPDRALERLEGEASAGSPRPQRQQAPCLVSGSGRCDPDRSPGEPSLLPKERQVSPCHVVSEGDTAGPSHGGTATKLGACRSTSKPKPLATTPSRAPKLPGQPRKPTEMGSPARGELAPGPEDRMKPTTPKARPRPSSQGSGGARAGTKTRGGSQPQPSSGRLQSETATTPAKPGSPGQGPALHLPPPRAQARGCQEKAEGSERRRKGPGPARRVGAGSMGRAPSAPDRPPRAPRKQATPSRLLPAKPRLSGQLSKTRPQPWEARKVESGPGHRREAQGKAFPQVRRGRSVSSSRPAELRHRRTAEAQSDLLSQLFGQRLTSFKIPLKKDTSE
ncbi:zinc finger protein 469 [Fukomys damarensis]|uniref:zinc finger protein 469 n=1 Tax=Fukomys damarensis TaxID=885580 RepID=UPI0014553DDB|nr:zinc finger protein 469 [Fukomys damarensis]